MVVPPVYVFVPESINTLPLIFVNDPVLLITPPNVIFPLVGLIDELVASVMAPA